MYEISAVCHGSDKNQFEANNSEENFASKACKPYLLQRIGLFVKSKFMGHDFSLILIPFSHQICLP